MPRYYWPCRVSACTVLLSSSPQVPTIQRESPDQAHATSMPGVVWPVNRFLPNLSWGNINSLVLTPFGHFDTCAVVHLYSSSWSTPDICNDAFSITLTTKALNQSRLWWLATCSCKPIAGGLLPSLTPLLRHTDICHPSLVWLCDTKASIQHVLGNWKGMIRISGALESRFGTNADAEFRHQSSYPMPTSLKALGL